MWGAIIGDLAGSIYEYEQSKKVSEIKVKNLIEDNSFFSDDTILTVAIVDAILNDKNYEYYLKKYAKEYMNKIPKNIPYFKGMFSPGFTKWVNGNTNGVSTGNGAMMRISGVGYLFNNEKDIKLNAYNATIPSHNSKEAIDNATIIALIIYYARKGYNKEQIISKLNLKIEYISFEKFNITCSKTIDNILYALFSSNSFEESIKKVISFGGDTDTNACITGSMAEALFGIDKNLIDIAKRKLPTNFVKTIDTAYSKILMLK